MRRDWPLVLIAAAFLLGAAAQYFSEGGVDVFGGALIALGSACVGAWLTDDRKGRGDNHDS